MNRLSRFAVSFVVVVLVASAGSPALAQRKIDSLPIRPGQGGAAKPAKSDELYAAPSPDEARSRTIEAVAARGVKEKAILDEVARIWTFGEDEPAARLLLDKVVSTASLIDPKAQAFALSCTLSEAPLIAPKPEFLEGSAPDDFFANHLRLFYGRYLAERRMYDEGLSVLEEIDPKRVVDPASALFFRAVCEHQLLMKTEALASLEKLTKNTEGVPASYTAVATLMQYEIQGLSEKTLPHVSRKMADSERRLDLGRVGERVQKVQDEIIADLDEIIEKMEQEAGGGGGGGGSGSGKSNQSSSPAQDSTVKGSTAPGEVDQKNVNAKGQWGALNETETAKAKNQIGRKFPSHYRQAVEEYFKKLASRPAGK